MESNKLLMYLLQCRSKDFISRFKQVGNYCHTGIMKLYSINYANRLLLNSDDWMPSFRPVVEHCRKGCDEIDRFLRTQAEIPHDFESSFKQEMTEFSLTLTNKKALMICSTATWRP